MFLAAAALAAAQPAPVVRPFAEAVKVGDMLYLSGQIGILPGANAPVPGGLEAEAKQTMDNIGATLKRYGLSFNDLVQCRVFLADIKEWAAFNAVYVRYFPTGKFPARSALGANGLALGARVEVECMAHDPGTSTNPNGEK